MRALHTSRILRLAIILWWILFSLIAFGVSTLSYLALDRPVNLKNNFLWHSAWMIWCGLSFLAIYLARRYPIEQHKLRANLIRQFLLGFLVVIINVALEFSIAFLGGFLRNDPMPRPAAFLGSLFGYKFHINLVIYWGIVGATNAYDYYLRFRTSTLVSAQLEAKLSQAELHALKSQLQPHFLFNTHHAIISLILQERNEDAITMLTRLSDLLRATLRHRHEQFSSLQEERETLELYLGIQAIRFADRLEVTLDFPSATLDAKVPYLILQPIAENSIRHGIDALPENGQLSVTAHATDQTLTLIVWDNGPGFDTTIADGIGLASTRSRLQQLYGSRHEFAITCREGSGTTVEIQIPFETVPHPSDTL